MKSDLIVELFKHDHTVRFVSSLIVVTAVSVAIMSPYSTIASCIFAAALGYRS